MKTKQTVKNDPLRKNRERDRIKKPCSKLGSKGVQIGLFVGEDEAHGGVIVIEGGRCII